MNNKGYEDIMELAKELGSIRFRLIQLAEEEREKMTKCNKEDQTFLHRIEFFDGLSDEEIVGVFKQEKEKREERREIKNRHYLIQALLGGILVKNPCRFLLTVINSTQKDVLKAIQEAKEDEELYKKTEL